MTGRSEIFKNVPEPETGLARYRILSSTAGVRVSPLCLGAMSFGTAWAPLLGAVDEEQTFKMLDAFAEAGGNFIDTANVYQEGQSEEMIGRWMAERDNRDLMFVATKFTHGYPKHKLGPGLTINYSGNDRKALRMAVRDSLRRLGTDYIDLLYVHFWDWSTSVEELIDALHALVEQGTVLYLGICNTPAWIVAAANTYARAAGKTPFSVYQGRWNVIHRDFEREVIPMARHFGMALCPWDVLSGGKLQTAAQIAARRDAGESLRPLRGPDQTEDERRASEVLQAVAAEHNDTKTSKNGAPVSIQQVALAYVMQKARGVIPIVGGRKVEHLRDNIAALRLHLTDDQIRRLDAARPFDPGFPTDMIGDDPRETGETVTRLAAYGHINWQPNGKPIGRA